MFLIYCIENWYSRRKRHSALGYKTIDELEINNYKLKTQPGLTQRPQ